DYPAGEPLLVLLSGGASACVEVPTNGIGEAELASRWRSLLASGRPIEEVNRERSAWSRLKGGRLGRLLLECTPSIRVWLLADTDPASAPETVGSGPFWLPEAPGRIPHHTLAHNGDLVAAAGLRLGTEGWSVYRHGERITGEAERDVGAFLTALHRLPRDGPVALVGGGEPRVALPPDAPRGGRSQHAALRAATWLRSNRSDALFAAFASDGMDGSTDAAGAWVTAEDGGAGAEAALARFDAHGHLKARGRLVHVGATGTNVNDLWVALRPAP
ncbi:MAG TPA: MOFRL family protein, partial [Candidatus Thermoplasmatota archaeon]|nr:MOFRL family protein [Candidatus Thermoplasmatota archaeon]